MKYYLLTFSILNQGCRLETWRTRLLNVFLCTHYLNLQKSTNEHYIFVRDYKFFENTSTSIRSLVVVRLIHVCLRQKNSYIITLPIYNLFLTQSIQYIFLTWSYLLSLRSYQWCPQNFWLPEGWFEYNLFVKIERICEIRKVKNEKSNCVRQEWKRGRLIHNPTRYQLTTYRYIHIYMFK